MKASDIIRQLQAVLPSVTDLFTGKITVTSLSYAGGVVTAVAPGHGLTTGKYANIVGATNPIGVTSITRVGTVATVVTTTDHDLTLGRVDIKNGGKTVDLTGSTEAEFNGTFSLASVLNRRTFTIEVADAGATVATGSPLLQNGSVPPGFNGRYPVTVTGTDTFTYPVSQVLFATAGGTPYVKPDARISGAATIERAMDAYTKQASGALWAFVVIGDVIASKNREIRSDMTDTMTRRSAWKQRLTQPFTVYVFTPTVNDRAGATARDTMEDVSVALFRSLLGVKFDTGYFASNQYATTFINHGFSDYNTAFYVHEFNFELAADITFDDTVGYDFDTAFRNIELGIVPDFGTQEDPATAGINLDEEPL